MQSLEQPSVQYSPVQERPHAKNQPSQAARFEASMYSDELDGPATRPGAKEAGQVVSEVVGTQGVVLQAHLPEKPNVESQPLSLETVLATLDLLEAQGLDTSKSKGKFVEARLRQFVGIPPSVVEKLIASKRWYPLSALGEGGMAKVYKMYDLNLRKFAAVKVMVPIEGDEKYHKENVARLEREAHALAMVRDDHAVRVYDAAYTPEGGYIAMDYVEGPDLHQEIERRGPLPEKEAADITLQILSGVDAFHKAGVVHRDLKPANILHNKENDSYEVSDLGLSLPVDSIVSRQEQGKEVRVYQKKGKTLTDAGLTVGTPEYMAPEQAVMGGEITPAVDYWAMGVILYKLTTGNVPFDKPEAADILKSIQQDAFLPPIVHRQDLSPEMNALILALLNKQPEKRPNLIQMQESLREIMQQAEDGEEQARVQLRPEPVQPEPEKPVPAKPKGFFQKVADVLIGKNS